MIDVIRRPISNFTIDSPIPGTARGSLTVAGSAGTQWINVAAFDMAGNKVSGDNAPMAGRWSLAIDTTKLSNGIAVVDINAYSVAAGQTGGVSATVPLSLPVNNAPLPVPVPIPVPAPKPIGVTAAQIKAIEQQEAVVQADTAKLTTDQATLRAMVAALKPAS